MLPGIQAHKQKKTVRVSEIVKEVHEEENHYYVIQVTLNSPI